MMAKSPRRRAISIKQEPERGGAIGSSTSTSISSGASAVVSAPTKKSRGLDPALAAHRLGAQPAAEREHDRRHFRSRIGMRKIAADGAAIADLRMRDVRQRLGNERQVGCGRRIALEAAIARQRADAQTVRAVLPDAGKLLRAD